MIRFRDPNGRQRQRAARTLAEARRLRSELAADMTRGEYRERSTVTLAAYVETWLASYQGRTRRGIRPETLDEDRRDLRRAVAYFGERRRLADIGPSDVKAYARALADGTAPAEDKRSQRPLAAPTIRRVLAPLRALYGTAVEDEVVRTDPTLRVRVAAPAPEIVDDDDGPVKALVPDELAALLTGVPDDWRGLLVRTLAGSGLRLSEGLGLRYRDVDTVARRLRVRQRVRNGKVGAVKSRYSRREVPISAALSHALAAHRLASPFSGESDLVFCGPTGAPLRSWDLYDWLGEAMTAAGAPWAGFHSLRHTYATRLLLGGVNIATVSRLLGPGFTLSTYIHVLPADLPDGEVLAAAIGLD